MGSGWFDLTFYHYFTIIAECDRARGCDAVAHHGAYTLGKAPRGVI